MPMKGVLCEGIYRLVNVTNLNSCLFPTLCHYFTIPKPVLGLPQGLSRKSSPRWACLKHRTWEAVYKDD